MGFHTILRKQIWGFHTNSNKKIWGFQRFSLNNTHKSLDEFCRKFSDCISSRYLVYTKDLRKDEQTLLIPICMTMHL